MNHNKNKISNQKLVSNKKPRLRHFLIVFFWITNIIYLGWRAAYTMPENSGILSLFFSSALLIAELTGFLENAIFYFTLWNPKNPKVPEVSDHQDWPDVDIFIATYNEPIDLLYKTLNACTHLIYPDKSKVHVFLCDDGNRDTAAALAHQFGFEHLSREDNSHAKAGNLNNALRNTNSPLVVTIDADMIPRSNFLMRTVPFFINNDAMGFVQTPQSFYNPDTFQYNLFMEDEMPNEQDLFFRLVQVGRSKYNATIYAGSNTVLSRKALEEIGGFATDTITEDFATGMQMQSVGYTSIYLNEILANGLTPNSLVDLFNQRIRWANGVIQTLRKNNPFFKKGLGLLQKLLYFSSLSYWFFGFRRLIFLSSPLLFVIFGVRILDASLIQVLIFWLPMFLVNHYTFRYFSEGIRDATWSNIYETILAPQIALNLLKEIFGIRLSKFKVTPKETVTRQGFNQRFRLVKTQLVFLCFGVFALIRLLLLYLNGVNMEVYTINIYWILFNVYILGISILYAIERPIFRQSERFELKLPVRVTKDRACIIASTLDCSEFGLSIVFAQPSFFEPDRKYLIQIQDRQYDASLEVTIIRSFQLDEKFISAFKIQKRDDLNYRNYLQILFDRVPPVTREQRSSTIWQKITKIVKGRQEKPSFDTRLHHQFLIGRELPILVGNQLGLIDCIDFDFVYLTVKLHKPKPLEQFALNLDPTFRPIFKYDSAKSMRHFQSEHPVYYYRAQKLELEQELKLLSMLRPKTTEDYYRLNE